MRIILLDNIKGVGMIGDIKDVNDGYARNFLLPKRLARPATPGIEKEVEKLKQRKLTEVTVAKDNAQKVADYLKDITIEFSAKANEKGTLFDGIEKKDIAKAIKEQKGVSIEEENVQLDEHIKHAGEHTVTIKLAPEITVPVRIIVSAQ